MPRNKSWNIFQRLFLFFFFSQRCVEITNSKLSVIVGASTPQFRWIPLICLWWSQTKNPTSRFVNGQLLPSGQSQVSLELCISVKCICINAINQCTELWTKRFFLFIFRGLDASVISTVFLDKNKVIIKNLGKRQERVALMIMVRHDCPRYLVCGFYTLTLQGDNKTRSPTPWSTLWSTPKNHVLVK